MLRTAAVASLRRLVPAITGPSFAVRAISSGPSLSRRPDLSVGLRGDPISLQLLPSFVLGRGYARRRELSETDDDINGNRARDSDNDDLAEDLSDISDFDSADDLEEIDLDGADLSDESK